MEKKLTETIKAYNNIIKQDRIKDKDELLKDLLTQISFFQHERLVHLLVTIFVGIIAILFFLFGLLLQMISLFLLFGIMLFLFVPYIMHYYKLENGIQKLYSQYNELKKKRTRLF